MINQRAQDANAKLQDYENYVTDEKSLLAELNFALADFFVCERDLTDDGIIISLENGQKFIISVKQI